MAALFAILFCLPALTLAQGSLKPYDVTAGNAFTELDTNRDGVLDRNELDHFFKGYDTNSNGVITYHEFTTIVNQNHVHNPSYNHFLHSLYAVYDVNNDNEVNHHDFDQFFALADSNSDNLLEKPEYVHYLSVLFAALEGV